MKPLAVFTTLALFAPSVFSAAISRETPTNSSSVTMRISHENDCSTSAGTFTVGTACKLFPADTESLKVMHVLNNGHVQYNSLRVYHNENCTGFGDIEPALGCAGPGADGCRCSSVGAYKSIRLVADK